MSAQERYEWCVLCEWTDVRGVFRASPYSGESLFPRGTAGSEAMRAIESYVIERLRATDSAKIAWNEFRWVTT